MQRGIGMNIFYYMLALIGGYLIDDSTDRKGLYIKNGYEKIKILKAGEGGFSDIDLWIMHNA